jgi:hypothetical protein
MAVTAAASVPCSFTATYVFCLTKLMHNGSSDIRLKSAWVVKASGMPMAGRTPVRSYSFSSLKRGNSTVPLSERIRLDRGLEVFHGELFQEFIQPALGQKNKHAHLPAGIRQFHRLETVFFPDKRIGQCGSCAVAAHALAVAQRERQIAREVGFKGRQPFALEINRIEQD